MGLYQQYLNNKGPVVHKWHHYFPVYERHFSSWKNRSLTFWEIGVFKGGSLPMWQQYFGPYARVVGIDIDPSCKAHERSGISVRIGNQSDPVFLNDVVAEFGVPDIVLDDGSHRMGDLWTTFQHLYPLMGKNGIYAIEDLHTCYWPEYGGGLHHPDSMIEKAKHLIDQLNADHARGAVAPNAFTKSTYSLCFYDSLLVIEKGNVWRKEADAIGTWDREFPRPEMRVGS